MACDGNAAQGVRGAGGLRFSYPAHGKQPGSPAKLAPGMGRVRQRSVPFSEAGTDKAWSGCAGVGSPGADACHARPNAPGACGGSPPRFPHSGGQGSCNAIERRTLDRDCSAGRPVPVPDRPTLYRTLRESTHLFASGRMPRHLAGYRVRAHAAFGIDGRLWLCTFRSGVAPLTGRSSGSPSRTNAPIPHSTSNLPGIWSACLNVFSKWPSNIDCQMAAECLPIRLERTPGWRQAMDAQDAETGGGAGNDRLHAARHQEPR